MNDLSKLTTQELQALQHTVTEELQKRLLEYRVAQTHNYLAVFGNSKDTYFDTFAEADTWVRTWFKHFGDTPSVQGDGVLDAWYFKGDKTSGVADAVVHAVTKNGKMVSKLEKPE